MALAKRSGWKSWEEGQIEKGRWRPAGVAGVAGASAGHLRGCEIWRSWALARGVARWLVRK
eukprot:8752093-Alexandrium_andersonii.AAC.1